ncbi:MAG: ribosome maturation factor RimP, partial [Terriglobia bacterium]
PGVGPALRRWPGAIRSPTAVMTVDFERIQAIAERVVTSEGLTLVDVELKGGKSNPLLRIYIDKPQGISHQDCKLVSEQVSAILDVEDPFPGSYVLEVSSPGWDRKLVKASDYQYFMGRRARVILKEPLDNQKVWEGRLAGFESGRVRLDMNEAGMKEIDLENISKARLVPEW